MTRVRYSPLEPLFGIETRVRTARGKARLHLHVILFRRNICLGRFDNTKKYIDPIALFYDGLCKK